MFECRILVDRLHGLCFGLLGAVKEELKFHVINGVTTLVCDDLEGGAILCGGRGGSCYRRRRGINVRPIGWQLVETGDDGIGRKDPIVLGVHVRGGARDVLSLRLDNGGALLAVGEVNVKQLRLKDVTVVLETAVGREGEIHIARQENG